MINLTPILDFRTFANRFLYIKTEYGEIIPLRLNSAQERVLQIIESKLGTKLKYDGLPANVVLRLIILKARQQGISTLIQAIIFWYNFLTNNQRTLTMAHEGEASNNLFGMYKRFHEYLDDGLRRKIKHSNEKKIQWLKNGSENKVATAGDTGNNKAGTGRSDTMQLLHASEAAFYPDPLATFLGLLQGAKYAKMHFIESTANGYNEFFTKWEEAVKEGSIYTPIFLSWLDFPEYVQESKKLGFIIELKGKDLERFKRDLGNPQYNEYPNEEKILMEEYGVTIDQLQWRRYAIDNLCEKDVALFHQEYPRDSEEAFISTGRPVFPQYKVQQHFVNLKDTKPLKRGELVVKYDDSDDYKKKISEGKTSYLELKEHIEGVEFIEDERGFISIWTDFEPQNNEFYRFVAGADIAEGLEQGDYNDLRVLDRGTNEVCLTWHGHIDPDLFAEEVHKIYLFIKDLHVAVERNNHGLTVINKLFELGIPQYYRQSFDKGYPEDTSSIGWKTGQSSKKYMTDIMIEWIREDYFKDYDRDFWNECRTFVKNSKGQRQADGKDKDPSVKNYDDRVIAACVMVMCDMWLPAHTVNTPPEPVARPFILDKKKSKGITRF